MMIPPPRAGTSAKNNTGENEPASFAPNRERATPPAAQMRATSALAYGEFAAALKDALRAFHSPDLLARNPLLSHGVYSLGGSAGRQS